VDEILRLLQSRHTIESFCVREVDGTVHIDVWMNGTSYFDDAVTRVRKDIESEARKQHRCAVITIAAILERFEIDEAGEPATRTHHQSVAKTD
jgi:hypothetical protein